MRRRTGQWLAGVCALVAVNVLICSSAPAQQNGADAKQAVTAADYEHAEKFMSYNVNRLVYGSDRATWLSDDHFWYRFTTPSGSEFMIVDAATGHSKQAFDHAALASALSAATGTHYDPWHLPARVLGFSEDGGSISFAIRGKRWECDLQGYTCAAKDAVSPTGFAPPAESLAGQTAAAHNEALSPDGKSAVLIRDYNLWMHDVATGKETQLTTDGVKDFGYATDNAGWTHSDRPIVLWSPDSKKIATYQQDQRGVGEMYLVHTQVGHPMEVSAARRSHCHHDTTRDH